MEEWKNETPEKKIERLELVKDRLESEIKMLKEVVHNLAQAIRFMSTNEKLTVEDIIKEFTENPVTEEFMERWEKAQLEESLLKDKVIDMMTEYIDILVDRMIEFEPGSADTDKDFFCNHIEKCVNDCADCIRAYYFNKAKEDGK